MNRFIKRKRNNVIATFVIGLGMVVGAFILLWTNEGRINYGEVAEDSVVVNLGQAHQGDRNELLAVTGELTSSAPISDDRFLRPDNYVWLERHVEMYAWVEIEESSEDTTSYSYELDWTDSPRSATEFHDSDGHKNPSLPFESGEYSAETVSVGVYQVDIDRIRLPELSQLILSSGNVREGGYVITSDYLFVGKGSLAEPSLGDVRVSFDRLDAGTLVTIFAGNQTTQLTPYLHQNKHTLYRMLLGTRAEAIAKLHTEYTNLLWGFRLFGVMMMWGGFALAFSPINRLFRLVPGGRDGGKLLIAGISAIFAILLSLITILISYIFHNIWVLAGVILLTLFGLFLWRQSHMQA